MDPLTDEETPSKKMTLEEAIQFFQDNAIKYEYAHLHPGIPGSKHWGGPFMEVWDEDEELSECTPEQFIASQEARRLAEEGKSDGS
jgi:hypothetical protein